MRPDNARTPAARATAAPPVSARWSANRATGAGSRQHSEARWFAAVGVLTQHRTMGDRGTKALTSGRQIQLQGQAVEVGRESGRESGCPSVSLTVDTGSLKKKKTQSMSK